MGLRATGGCDHLAQFCEVRVEKRPTNIGKLPRLYANNAKYKVALRFDQCTSVTKLVEAILPLPAGQMLWKFNGERSGLHRAP